jgi:hypothetical protein
MMPFTTNVLKDCTASFFRVGLEDKSDILPTSQEIVISIHSAVRNSDITWTDVVNI